PQLSLPPSLSTSPVRAELHSVNFRTGGGDVVLHIRRLSGELLPASTNLPPNFDDPASFVLRINSGEIGITPADLANLLNHYAFGYSSSPIRNIRISIHGDRVRQKGTLVKGVPIPFEAEGKLAPTPEGLLEFRAMKIKSAHVPVKGLMQLL